MTGKIERIMGLAFMPGLLLGALLLSGCGEKTNVSGKAELCISEHTPIPSIQGEGYRSPLENRYQFAGGIVTRIEPGNGYYIEQPGHEAAPAASKAVFVQWHGEAGQAEPGHRVVVGGRVRELGSQRDTLTGISEIDRFAVCDEGLPLPLTQAELPLSNPRREALEGMRISIAQTLHVTDNYSARHGELTLSAGETLRIPTEDHAPGAAAKQADRDNRERGLTAHYKAWAAEKLAAGSRVSQLTGIFGHRRERQQLLTESARTSPAAVPERIDPPDSGHIRVVSANLLNFFNGNGRGAGFPTERGAETAAEFKAQSARIRAALTALQPDLVAVQELENDGFGRHSAAQSLLDLLGPEFAVVRTPEDRIGDDVITVGLFYRTSVLQPAGAPQTLGKGPFANLSREPLAQAFRDRESGTVFLAAVNHLKSKGGCPEGRDGVNADHGQGCWNPVRVESVATLLPWLQDISRKANTDLVLVLGDMNAYRREDPVERFRSGGYIELVEHHSGLPQHSYRYYGRAGTLDYAFATPGLADRTARALIWHINADWPRGMDLPQPWLRMSDHDPVVIDLALGESP
ncbi:MAG: ExeM/NucH family extracellular endonuclease [Xanthomonadales bacterium]|nr:ExeM/NucH family extracellular endonuclease [Xanthomonadales bacterium]